VDANDWFAASAGQPKPREHQNDFGGVLGGPIIKDKTFFFFSYEGLRVAQPKVTVMDVPSLAIRASAAPNVKVLVDGFPLPNGPSTGVDQSQYTASYSDPSTLDAVSLRIDHALSSKVTLFGRFDHSPSKAASHSFSPNIENSSTENIDTATLGSTAILSPAVTNDLRFNYSSARFVTPWIPVSLGGAVAPPASAMAAPWQDLATGETFYGIFSGRNSWLGKKISLDEVRS
jgi:hypothetical protein